jgi:hypothetical protein
MRLDTQGHAVGHPGESDFAFCLTTLNRGAAMILDISPIAFRYAEASLPAAIPSSWDGSWSR